MSEAAPKRLKVASAFATRLPELGSQGVEAVARINKTLGRRLKVTLYDPGKLAPPGRYLDPVIVAAIDAAWSAPNLLLSRNPVFGILGGPPFGMTAAKHMQWLTGPARNTYAAAYGQIGLSATPCGVISGQAFAQTQEPLEAPANLQSLRIGLASSGLSSDVLRAVGAQVRIGSPAALHVMTLNGALNAVTLGPYRVDLRMRTHQVAAHGFAPNPLAPAYVLDLIFGLKRWQSLTEEARAAIERSCADAIEAALSRQVTAEPTSLHRLTEDADTLGPLPTAVTEQLFKAWLETAQTIAATNAGFAAALADYPWPKGLEQ
jgi:TRAP-type mannitol/chloroaromatic compound transport system substrate-binding protein